MQTIDPIVGGKAEWVWITIMSRSLPSSRPSKITLDAMAWTAVGIPAAIGLWITITKETVLFH